MFRYLTRDTLIPVGAYLSRIPNGSKFRLTRAARTAMLQAMFHDVLMEHGWVHMTEPYVGITQFEWEAYGRFKKMRAAFASSATNEEWTYLKKQCRAIVEDVLKDYSLLTADFGYGMVNALNYKEGYDLYFNSARNCMVIRSYVAQLHGKTYALEVWPKCYLEYVNRGKKKSKPVTLDTLFDKDVKVTWEMIKEKMTFFDIHPTMYALGKAAIVAQKIVTLYKGKK